MDLYLCPRGGGYPRGIQNCRHYRRQKEITATTYYHALPLKSTDRTVLLGPGAYHTIAGNMHECSFGRLQDLTVSPFDALREKMSEVSQYPVYDDLGVAVPSKCTI